MRPTCTLKKITGYRVLKNGNKEFRCVWEGFGHGSLETWEPDSSLPFSESVLTQLLARFKNTPIHVSESEDDEEDYRQKLERQESVHKVEKILDYHVNPDTNQELVFIKWMHFPIGEATWEPITNVMDLDGLADDIRISKSCYEKRMHEKHRSSTPVPTESAPPASTEAQTPPGPVGKAEASGVADQQAAGDERDSKRRKITSADVPGVLGESHAVVNRQRGNARPKMMGDLVQMGIVSVESVEEEEERERLLLLKHQQASKNSMKRMDESAGKQPSPKQPVATTGKLKEVVIPQQQSSSAPPIQREVSHHKHQSSAMTNRPPISGGANNNSAESSPSSLDESNTGGAPPVDSRTVQAALSGLAQRAKARHFESLRREEEEASSFARANSYPPRVLPSGGDGMLNSRPSESLPPPPSIPEQGKPPVSVPSVPKAPVLEPSPMVYKNFVNNNIVTPNGNQVHSKAIHGQALPKPPPVLAAVPWGIYRSGMQSSAFSYPHAQTFSAASKPVVVSGPTLMQPLNRGGHQAPLLPFAGMVAPPPGTLIQAPVALQHLQLPNYSNNNNTRVSVSAPPAGFIQTPPNPPICQSVQALDISSHDPAQALRQQDLQPVSSVQIKPPAQPSKGSLPPHLLLKKKFFSEKPFSSLFAGLSHSADKMVRKGQERMSSYFRNSRKVKVQNPSCFCGIPRALCPEAIVAEFNKVDRTLGTDGIQCNLCKNYFHLPCSISFLQFEIQRSQDKHKGDMSNLKHPLHPENIRMFVDKFLCPYCSLGLCDPFVPAEEVLCMTMIWPNLESSSTEGGGSPHYQTEIRMSFVPTKQELDPVKGDFSRRLQMRCICLKSDFVPYPKFPHSVKFYYNSEQRRSNFSKTTPDEEIAPPALHRKRKDTNRQFNPKYVENANGLVNIQADCEFSGSSDGPFLIAVCKVFNEVLPHVLAHEIKTNVTLEKDECEAHICRVIESQEKGSNVKSDDTMKTDEDDSADLEVVESMRSFCLHCPSTLLRMTYPARGINCKHLQCFDLDFYCNSQATLTAFNNRWRCAVCGAPARPHELFVDSFFLEILKSTSDSDRTVYMEVIKDPEAKNRLKWHVTERNEDMQDLPTGNEYGNASTTELVEIID